MKDFLSNSSHSYPWFIEVYIISTQWEMGIEFTSENDVRLLYFLEFAPIFFVYTIFLL